MKTVFLALVVMLGVGCEQAVTRQFGGEMTQEIPCNTRLVEATWKDADLWFLVRTLEEGETPRKFIFKESSTYGAFEGTVKFEEKLCK